MKKLISGILLAWLIVFPLCCIVTLANANVYEGQVGVINGSGTVSLKGTAVFSGPLEFEQYTTKISCSLASDNPEELKEYCREVKKEFPRRKEVISATYIKDGMTLTIKIEDCDKVPQKSICIDDKHCALCYFDERK